MRRITIVGVAAAMLIAGWASLAPGAVTPGRPRAAGAGAGGEAPPRRAPGAVPAALRFARAWSAYVVDPAAAGAAGRVRASASPALWRLLRTVRVPSGPVPPPRESLAGAWLTSADRSRASVVVELRSRRAQASYLAVVLRRGERGWTVAGVSP